MFAAEQSAWFGVILRVLGLFVLIMRVVGQNVWAATDVLPATEWFSV